MNKLMIILS